MWKTSHGNRFPESLSCTLCRHGDRIGPHRITAEDLPESTWQVGMDCGAVLGRLTPPGTQTHAGSERMGPRADAMPMPLARETLWLLVPLPTSTPSLPNGMETRGQGEEAGPGWHLCKRVAFGFESGQRRSPNLRPYALGFSLPTPDEVPESRGPLSV